MTAPETPPAAFLPTVDIEDSDTVSALIVDLSRTARILFAGGSVDGTLTEVLALAKSTIEGCDFAGILLIDGDTATTPAHTDPVAAALNTFQHRNEGPCIDAIAQKVIFYADDLTGDVRWPLFGAEALPGGYVASCRYLCSPTAPSVP